MEEYIDVIDLVLLLSKGEVVLAMAKEIIKLLRFLSN